MDYKAHTLEGRERSEWEPLEDHLLEVARRIGDHDGSGGFAAAFDACDIGRLAGLWHDLGKYSTAFQTMLNRSHAGQGHDRVDHSTAGALHAIESLRTKKEMKDAALALAFVIAGHHAGLADLGTSNSVDESTLLRRLKSPPPECQDARSHAPEWLRIETLRHVPRQLCHDTQATPIRRSMFIRMLFSALIDADRLATERAVNPETSSLRPTVHPRIADLRAALDTYLESRVDRTQPLSSINRIRAGLLADCRSAAAKPPGLFTLTAPTGSGKTLSSMAFALAHAETHGLERVIYALPFTSVTEQNAGVFRNVFASIGPDVVLEHHSAYDAERAQDPASRGARAQDETMSPGERRRQLAVENWDSRVVVTTNVQLLESLFASETKRCRKLHRIARSVIILDEAQSLPAELLRPTLAAIHELVAMYGVTVVLCSATMPAVMRRSEFPIGLDPAAVTEIVPDRVELAATMRRVRVRVTGLLSDEEVAAQVAGHEQTLLVLNTRPHAARVFGLVKNRASDVLHLSASMCPAHRADRVKEIKQRLRDGLPCRVVSTQVVEAGIDIDFPRVFRAMAGLDSIVQAAGRCNREGKFPSGEVVVFETDEQPTGDIGIAAASTREVLGHEPGQPAPDPLDLATIEHYFRQHYWSKGPPEPGWDGRVGPDGRRCGITKMLEDLNFASASGQYRIIEEGLIGIVVPYGREGVLICEEVDRSHLLSGAEQRNTRRRAQRYTVGVRPWQLRTLLESVLCHETESGMFVLGSEAYDEHVGLRIDAQADPTRSMV